MSWLAVQYFVGFWAVIFWVWAASGILAGCEVVCRGSNRENRLWRFSWDNRRIMRPIGFAMWLAPLLAGTAFIAHLLSSTR